MNTIAAAVTGASHLRSARNGQDAAATWSGPAGVAAVVCDGCSAGAYSEVGARLGAALAVRLIAERLEAGVPPRDLWPDVRVGLVRRLEQLAGELGGIHDHLLFTIVAAAVTRDELAVWAIGDGAYAIGGATRTLGPFDDNRPPYLAYDLVDTMQPAHLEIAAPAPLVVATDGAAELDLTTFASPRFVEHPDALRRHLAVLARPTERISWDEQRVERTPALLQDDCAIAVVLP